MTHPNRVPFDGVLTTVGTASARAPSGSRGHIVILTREAAEEALPSLIGMGLCYKVQWDGHDARRKIGVITHAEIVYGGDVHVRGYVFGRDFKDVVDEMRDRSDLGMSYELADAQVDNMREKVWTLNRVTFTGAAVLRRDLAAYNGTSFRLAETETDNVHREKTP